MSNKITNNNNSVENAQSRVAVTPPVLPPDDIFPTVSSVETYGVNKNTGEINASDTINCSGNNLIQCDITLAPNTEFANLKRALLILPHVGGTAGTFAAYITAGGGILAGAPFAYLENRRDDNGNITCRVVDISSLVEDSKSQSFSIAIQAEATGTCSISASGVDLEMEYLENDDFIPNVAKFERSVGAKGACSVNTRNGKLFYTQNLIAAKGGRMSLNLSMTYNAADCDNNSPNGFATGIKGWTFNYAQALKTTPGDYTLLDGAHMYRTFKSAANTSAVKCDVSGKSGLYLNEASTQYTISDGKSTTYKFDTNKRLAEISYAGGSSATITSIVYNGDGKIASITDGMSDTYTFVYSTDAITISCGSVDMVRITLEDERVKSVEYLLVEELYEFGYDSEGKLLTVTDSASNEKTIFEYSDALAVTAVKNYIYKNSTASPVDCYFLEYKVLETLVKKSRNTDQALSSYTTVLYVFADNGETIFTCEDASTTTAPGLFKNMRFQSKNDYEKYAIKIAELNSALSERNCAKFQFGSNDYFTPILDELNSSISEDSTVVSYNTADHKSKNYVFASKLFINYDSYIKSESGQSIHLELVEDDEILATLVFDPGRRGYQVKSTIVELPHVEH